MDQALQSRLLFPGRAASSVRFCVIVPARNEAANIKRALSALLRQGNTGSFEILVLVNNTTDDTRAQAEVIAASTSPCCSILVEEMDLAPGEAHIGNIRRLLMDAAARRLEHQPDAVILSTDSDTEVAPDWIEANGNEIDRGVDAVGGLISLDKQEYAALPPNIRLLRDMDDRYRLHLSWLEHCVDPQTHDRWPRHYHHFAGSFAIRRDAYLQVGGLPPVPALEDVALYEELCAHDLRVRHSPDVKVITSARTAGRTSIGLAEQLAHWQAGKAEQIQVDAVDALRKRWELRRQWREAWPGQPGSGPFGAWWRDQQCRLPPLAKQPLPEAIEQLRHLREAQADRSDTPALAAN